MGPKHMIDVMGMGQFEELEIVKRDREQGKSTNYKVVLCKAKGGKWLVVAIDLI